MRSLSIQLDAVAALREFNGGKLPDPIEFAFAAQSGGADSISVHLREDRRFIQERDLRLLREVVNNHLNLEMAPTQELLKIALDIKPDSVTLVEPARSDGESDGPLDVGLNQEKIHKFVLLLSEANIEVRVRIDSDIDQVRNAHRAGVRAIEIHSARLMKAIGISSRATEKEKLIDCIKVASRLKMHVVVGGTLTREGVALFADLEGLHEVKVGHAAIARGLAIGLEQSVRELKAVL